MPPRGSKGLHSGIIAQGAAREPSRCSLTFIPLGGGLGLAIEKLQQHCDPESLLRLLVVKALPDVRARIALVAWGGVVSYTNRVRYINA